MMYRLVLGIFEVFSLTFTQIKVKYLLQNDSEQNTLLLTLPNRFSIFIKSEKVIFIFLLVTTNFKIFYCQKIRQFIHPSIFMYIVNVDYLCLISFDCTLKIEFLSPAKYYIKSFVVSYFFMSNSLKIQYTLQINFNRLELN